jgi:hypothetical protein
MTSSNGQELLLIAALAFAGLWPLAMYLGAAISAASAVTEEIELETALQLVLTPVASRPLAAAKILPRVRPYLWGIVAALPLYALVGSSSGLLGEGVIPLPTLVWPFRLVAPLVYQGEMKLSALGILVIAPLMCILDMSLVWAAAHWGAVFAIRHRRLLPTVVHLIIHLPLTAAAAGLCVIGAGLAAMLPVSCAIAGSGSGSELFAGLCIAAGVLAGTATLAFLWWHVVLVRPAEEALTAFQAFDRLANAEFDVGIPRWVETKVQGKRH